MRCKYCGKECKNLNSLRNHERLCKENPNRETSNLIIYYSKNQDAKRGNRYTKAKEKGIKYIDKPETLEKLSNSFKNHKHTSTTKEKISRSRKKYLEEYPEKIPWKLNHSSKISYPEKYFLELFKKENIDLQYHKQVGLYELDFYNDKLKKYVEIDGEQHYTPEMIKHDKIRSDYLYSLGWKELRIRWKEYKKMSSKEKENKIQEIKEFIS